MTDLVPADQIEQIVGARRHALAHLGRAVSAEQTVYILHSHACKDSGIDLRACTYSKALDRGIDPAEWAEDETVTLQVEHGHLMPDDDGPDDIEHLTRPGVTDRCDHEWAAVPRRLSEDVIREVCTKCREERVSAAVTDAQGGDGGRVHRDAERPGESNWGDLP